MSTPLDTPSRVHYPNVDLASMLKHDIDSHAARLKETAEQADSQQARIQARSEASGDYSRWIVEERPTDKPGAPSGSAAGKANKGRQGNKAAASASASTATASDNSAVDAVVSRAAKTLSSNSTIDLENRQELLSKLESFLLRK